jgi:5-formyltetrahydrofolate cyclo-ligase
VTEPIDQVKQAIRNRIWDLLEREGVVEPGVHGYIPAFKGADTAADRLARLPAWQRAHVVKAVPDRAQQPVRERALCDGKLLYMAVPKLADDPPFYLIDPARLTVPPAKAADREVVARIATTAGTNQMRPVDLVICGSVAVNRHGTRLGKGEGYSDIEVALLQEAGLISPETVIATTIHQLQVLDGPLPETTHDFSVDLIITPDEVIECAPQRRPAALDWAHLSPAQIAAIPVLAARASQTPQSSSVADPAAGRQT